ncbi:hypothetical protein CDC50_07675 [Capnocytophaga sputigena]|nr:hypothetical protein CDC50_07675 [Capnocytophaga sputigena]
MINSLDELIQKLIPFSQIEEAKIRLAIDDTWDADSLSCQIDNGKYMLLYYTTDLDNTREKYPRSYNRRLATHNKIEINGDLYDENTICYDFGFVLMLFKEFFQQKDIPLYILD